MADEKQQKAAPEAKQPAAVASAARESVSAEERLAQAERELADTRAKLAQAQGDASAKAQAEAQAQAAKDAEAAAAERVDETIPGGRYLVNGILVDCDGKPLEK
jgi:colicin import membrane protein